MSSAERLNTVIRPVKVLKGLNARHVAGKATLHLTAKQLLKVYFQNPWDGVLQL